MKRIVLMVLGVFIAMLLAIPVLAETDVTSTMGAAASSPGGISIDTQSPVLDGAAYTNYDTVFFHGAMAKANPSSKDISFEGDYSNGHRIVINPSAIYVYVNCPFVSYDSKQGGIQPRVRYLGLDYKTTGSAEIFAIVVFNGHSSLGAISFDPLKSTSDYSVQVFDLGGWYRFDRGLGICLLARNPSSTSTGQIDIGGYGARYEW